MNVALANLTIDCKLLKQDYPWVDFIGLVGFDTKRHTFVLVKVGTETENTNDTISLSKREREVLQWVAMGCTNVQIAQKLTISENTVKAHLQKIFVKLKVQSRTEAAMHALIQGWMAG